MDLLTDVLQQAGLQRRLLDLRHLDAASALRFPCDKSLGLHVAVQGPLYLHAGAQASPLALQAGDIAVMARGCHHVISTRSTLEGQDVRTVVTDWGVEAVAAGTAVISGAYQLWNTPLHPFFAQMPDWFVLRADAMPRPGPLALSLELLERELRQRELGADTIVHGLMDVIFTYLLREIVAHRGETAGWSHAVRDPQVRRAVALMHADCARPWTLDALAARAGLSRTTLAERFRTAMGDTPLAYLRTVRMQKAMRLLGETGRTLEQVALEVGYQDAFGFSKVFKRTVGLSPREFRRRDAEDMASPWRVKST